MIHVRLAFFCSLFFFVHWLASPHTLATRVDSQSRCHPVTVASIALQGMSCSHCHEAFHEGCRLSSWGGAPSEDGLQGM